MVPESGENSPMRAKSKPRRAPARRYILVIDVGGTHVKFRIGPRGAIHQFDSGPKMTPGRMTRQLHKLLGKQRYDAVSIGYPGLVYHGRIAADPYNLGKGWVGYDFSTALERPVRLSNDAAMQAIGSYRGGRMLFIGLGTGLGSALILDDIIVPLELGELKTAKGRKLGDVLGKKGLKKKGLTAWKRAVFHTIPSLAAAFQA